MDRVKRRVREILVAPSADDARARVINGALMGVILLNVLVVIVETVESIAERFALLFSAFEVISVAIFTVEYVLRLWTCTLDTRFLGSRGGRLRFALSPLAITTCWLSCPSTCRCCYRSICGSCACSA